MESISCSSEGGIMSLVMGVIFIGLSIVLANLSYAAPVLTFSILVGYILSIVYVLVGIVFLGMWFCFCLKSFRRRVNENQNTRW